MRAGAEPAAAGGSAMGRFKPDQASFLDTLRILMRDEPMLLLLSLVAVLWQPVRKHSGLAATWFVCGLGFLAAQRFHLDNHVAVLFPPMALLATGLAYQRDRSHARAGPPHPIGPTPALLVVAVAGLSVLRVAHGLAAGPPIETGAVRWLRERIDSQSVVMAAPHVLMQLPGKPLAFFALRPPFVPTDSLVSALGVEWVVLGQPEWGGYLQRNGMGLDEAAKALGPAWVERFTSPGVQVWQRTARGRSPDQWQR